MRHDTDVEEGGQVDELSPEQAALVFENGLLRAGLLRTELEVVIMNAMMSKQFNLDEFEEWRAGELKDEDIRADRLELYREVVAAREAFEGCIGIAQGVVAGRYRKEPAEEAEA